jgi:hypothetical protein
VKRLRIPKRGVKPVAGFVARSRTIWHFWIWSILTMLCLVYEFLPYFIWFRSIHAVFYKVECSKKYFVSQTNTKNGHFLPYLGFFPAFWVDLPVSEPETTPDRYLSRYIVDMSVQNDAYSNVLYTDMNNRPRTQGAGYTSVRGTPRYRVTRTRYMSLIERAYT